ncbi:TetR/AcrR family transcriptional regulator [Methylobacterium nonmethylotrophicum]|uniref:TetR/AcrR family transcriptional regulator n=1 Tax=Methylobacterium nonmethylotrophicum TaxID=1141884 RepID=A0A4Z0NIX1_9HYPH|nr:TetR/AcrR family transcriptional regulator [Methylobacterium nonmethylotrophicum]TGD96075.1 TetR/AcrR family transcriptional regulator [Methylobacterium nonmethylotrophicum]
MRYAADHKQQTRERVLQVAATQIRKGGLDSIALAKVMADAGLTHGGFYAHFTSRDALLQASVEQMFATSPYATLQGKGRSPREALDDFVAYYLSAEHRDTRTGGCPLPFLTADAPRMKADVRDYVARAAARLRATVARHLAALGHADPEGEASSCVAEMIGAVILSRAEPDPVRSDAILARTSAAVRRRFNLEANT